MRKHSQKGFTVVEVLLALIFLAIIGFVIYYVVHSQSDKGQKPIENTSTQTTSDDTGATDQAGEAMTTAVSVRPALASGSMQLRVPNGWQVVSGATDTLSKVIAGKTYNIQFILAADSHEGTTYREYTHMTDDYASSDNSVVTTLSQNLFLVKSVSQNDVVVRTCAPLTDTSCYPTFEGKPLIVRLYNEKPGAQSYTGLEDFDSSATIEAISALGTIAQSLKN